MTSPRRYVVDASVGAKWVLAEAGSVEAVAFLEHSQRGHAELIAPDVFVAEVTNTIWKRARLANGLRDDEARMALRRTQDVLPDLFPSSNLVAQALELALAFRVAVYDCLYAALAVRDGATLVTADRPLVRALGPATGRVVHLEDLQLRA